MRLEGAIFDLDGTLTDSMYMWNEVPSALVFGWPGCMIPRRKRTVRS